MLPILQGYTNVTHKPLPQHTLSHNVAIAAALRCAGRQESPPPPRAGHGAACGPSGGTMCCAYRRMRLNVTQLELWKESAPP